MMIGLMGAGRSGKDTVAGFTGKVRFAFADPLKDAFATYHEIPRCWCDGLTEDGAELDREEECVFWEGPTSSGVTIREGLQRFGVAMRETLGAEFWVDQTDHRITESGVRMEDIVITDVRFENEVDFVRGMGGIVLGIDRPGQELVASHSSEELAKRMHEFADVVISNGGTLRELEDETRSVMAGFQ